LSAINAGSNRNITKTGGMSGREQMARSRP
jgi:hypothetical protein